VWRDVKNITSLQSTSPGGVLVFTFSQVIPLGRLLSLGENSKEPPPQQNIYTWWVIDGMCTQLDNKQSRTHFSPAATVNVVTHFAFFDFKQNI